MANNQNKILHKDELKMKYGDTKIGVIELKREVKEAIKEGGFLPRDTYVATLRRPEDGMGVVFSPLSYYATMNMEYMPRYEAEVSKTYIQPIVYCLLKYTDKESREATYFCMDRIGDDGDARLTDMSSIGVGGHVDDGESVVDAFYRELKEEVGIEQEHIMNATRMGYIYDPTTNVGKVHLGIVFLIELVTNEIEVAEKDKLRGCWVTFDHLEQLRDEGKLESWSDLCVDELREGKRL